MIRVMFLILDRYYRIGISDVGQIHPKGRLTSGGRHPDLNQIVDDDDRKEMVK